MTVLVTGASGHLGEAIMRLSAARGVAAVGVDIKPGPFTHQVGDIADSACVASVMKGARGVLHTATLHKPHVATHSRQDFVDVNVTGTLNLLEAARAEGVDSFIFTSTTSAFGDALRPAEGEPAAWITEEAHGAPKNIYGVTKIAAENLCELFHRKFDMACLVLRTSRFFPEEDDNAAIRDGFEDENAKVNELLYRRGDIEDMADAHFCALRRAGDIGFGKYIISATSPFTRDDLAELRRDAPAVLRRHYDYDAAYAQRDWRMFPSIDRVYVNDKARAELGWRPRYNFSDALERLQAGERPLSDLAYEIGAKGYHEKTFEDGPYPVED